MTGWKRVLRGVSGIGLALVVYFVVPVQGGEDVAVRALVTIVSLALLTAGVIWQVMVHVEDQSRGIDGLLFALVVAILAFALSFYRLEVTDPGQIPGIETRLDSLYFTMTTLLTVGYGDIHAAGQVARGLVLVAMVFNVAVIATAATTISGRVRLHAEQRAEARRAALESGTAQPRRTHRNPR